MEILLILLLGAFVSNYMARRIDKEAEEDNPHVDDTRQ